MAWLQVLAAELNLISEDLDPFIYELTNRLAADRVNGGDFPEDESWDDAYDRLHDEADKKAREINNGDLESQLAYLLEGDTKEDVADLLRQLFRDLKGKSHESGA